jgi:hypothetical protein
LKVKLLVLLVKDESILAISSWTPWDVLLNFKNVFQLKLVKFSVCLIIKQVLNIEFTYLLLAFLLRTNNREFRFINLALYKSLNAFHVKNVFTQL